MPFGQLNPLRTVAPPSTVTTGALANILGEQNKAFGNIGKDITEVGNVAEAFGRDVNTDALNDLIASGQLDDKGVSDIQQLIAQEAGGLRQSPEGLAMIDQLVSGAQAEELAGTKHGQAQELLKQKMELEDISRAKDQLFELQKMDKKALIDSGLFEKKAGLEKLLQESEQQFKAGQKAGETLDKKDAENRKFKQEKELAQMKIDAEERIARAKLGSAKSGLETGGIKKILEMEDPVEQHTEMVEMVLEDENLFFDAKFDEPTELLVKSAVSKAMNSQQGQSAFALGDRDLIMGEIKKHIPAGQFKNVYAGLGTLNPFGNHFLDIKKQTFKPKGE